MKKPGKELTIILSFSLLHAVMAVLSRLLGLSDHLTLTTLTMLMAVALCQVRRTSVNTMIIILIIVNFGGFYLSTYIGKALKILFSNTYLRGGLTTFITTLIVGGIVSGIVSLASKKGCFRDRKEISSYWLMLVFMVIIIARLTLIIINGKSLYGSHMTLNVIVDYIFCCLAMLYLATNAVKEAKLAQEAKEQTKLAQYSYIRLQQQVKPHFMFNNLNILNSLICDRQIDEASDFVYKLAYLYRYLIDNEDEKLVPLREEMDFVNKYIDLMKVRFESSFNVAIYIEENIMSTLVVPSSIQMLIENALKHNGGTSATPLMVRIYNTSTHIVVRNNRIEKNSCEPSTHLGLKYIRQMYDDVSPKGLKVDSSDEEFVVKLPIINLHI